MDFWISASRSCEQADTTVRLSNLTLTIFFFASSSFILEGYLVLGPGGIVDAVGAKAIYLYGRFSARKTTGHVTSFSFPHHSYMILKSFFPYALKRIATSCSMLHPQESCQPLQKSIASQSSMARRS